MPPANLGYRRVVLSGGLEPPASPPPFFPPPQAGEGRVGAALCRMSQESCNYETGARCIDSNAHLSRYKPEALPIELNGHGAGAPTLYPSPACGGGIKGGGSASLVMFSPKPEPLVGPTGREALLCLGSAGLRD